MCGGDATRIRAEPGATRPSTRPPGPVEAVARRFVCLRCRHCSPFFCFHRAGEHFDEFQVLTPNRRWATSIRPALVFGRRGGSPKGARPQRPPGDAGVAPPPHLHEVEVTCRGARVSGDVVGGGLKLRNTFVMRKGEGRRSRAEFDIEIRQQSTRFSEATGAMTCGRSSTSARPWQSSSTEPGDPLRPRQRGLRARVRAARQVSEKLARVDTTWIFGRVDAGKRRAGGQSRSSPHRHSVSERLAVSAGLGHGSPERDRWSGKMISRGF